MTKAVKDILVGIFMIIIGAVIIAVFVNIINNNNNNGGEQNENKMSISEAQEKCILMEEADLVNVMGEPFGAATTKKAEETCLSQWDMSKNPNNTEEKFIDVITADWEVRKTEVLEGYTLEALYNEAH